MGYRKEIGDLEVLLSYKLNRQLRQSELVAALGISRSAYNYQKTNGQLHNATNLLTVAAHFDLNPVELLLRYEYVNLEQIGEVWLSNEGRGKSRRHLGPSI